MTLEEIKAWLEQNKDDAEVSNYLNSLSAIDKDKVDGYLATDEGKRYLQPKLDGYFNKGLETWKENNLQKLVDEEVSKLNPTETPEQKKIRELEERLNQAEREKSHAAKLGDLTKRLSDEKLPTELAKFLIADEDEVVEKNFETFKNVFESMQSTIKETYIKDNGRNPFGSNGDDKGDTKSTIVDEIIKNKSESNDRAAAAAEKYGL